MRGKGKAKPKAETFFDPENYLFCKDYLSGGFMKTTQTTLDNFTLSLVVRVVFY